MTMQIQGRLCETGQPAVVTIEGTRIAAVEAPYTHLVGTRRRQTSDASQKQPSIGSADTGDCGYPRSGCMAPGDCWIAPGFIDLQLNGYGGYDFNRRFWREEQPDDAIPRIVDLAA